MEKTCPKCGVCSSDFGPNRARKDGLSTYCRPCTKGYMATKDYDKQRWATSKEFESARNKEYRQANAARLQEYQRAKKAEYRAKHAAKVRANNIARKHGLKKAMPAWADHQAMNALYREAKRLCELDGIPRHVDHIVPLKHPMVCGLHAHTNLQILAAQSNMAKHNSFEVWS